MPRFLHYSDIENVYDDPTRAARLAGLITELNGPDAAVVGSGDDTSPGVAATVAKGRQAIDFFRAVDADVETFGNHDFDFGADATRAIVADSPQTWVSANVFDETGARFGEQAGVVPWTIERVDGDRVGFFGVTDPATDSLNPRAADLGFADPTEAARDAVDALRAEGVDHVVAVSHLGGGDDDLARIDGVDLVLGGHVHTERVEAVDGTLCTRPGVNGETVLEVTLDGDAEADADDVEASVTRHHPTGAPVDEHVADALRERIAAAGLDVPVGRVDDPIERTEAAIHGGECRIGNLVADAYRAAADADVGLQNAGGLRLGPPLAGEVTLADLISVLPFEEPVVAVELTGAELLDAFRQMSAAVVDFGEDDWWHGHVSGATIVWDDDAELVAATVAGDRVDPDQRYRLATPEYILHSDHEFPVIEERHRAGEHGIQHEVLAAYIRDHGIDPQIEGRIRRVSGEASGGADGFPTDGSATDRSTTDRSTADRSANETPDDSA